MEEIQKIRKEIDKIDRELSKSLKKRIKKIKEISRLKKNKKWKSKSIQDKQRETAILEKMESEFEKNVFKKILSESRKIQRSSVDQ